MIDPKQVTDALGDIGFQTSPEMDPIQQMAFAMGMEPKRNPMALMMDDFYSAFERVQNRKPEVYQHRVFGPGDIGRKSDEPPEPKGSLSSINRKEFLEVVKYRAIMEMLDSGSPTQGLTSFMMDIGKYEGEEPLYSTDQVEMLSKMASMSLNSVSSMRYFIEGCN